MLSREVGNRTSTTRALRMTKSFTFSPSYETCARMLKQRSNRHRAAGLHLEKTPPPGCTDSAPAKPHLLEYPAFQLAAANEALRGPFPFRWSDTSPGSPRRTASAPSPERCNCSEAPAGNPP